MSDGRTLIYTPTPRLIEAGPNTTGCANAVLLGAPPAAVAADLGQNGEPPKVGRAPLDRAQSEYIKENLRENPPQKFDIARRGRVFNAYFEFVELQLLGAHIEKKTVQIPNHILGVLDGQTREQLRAQFRIVPNGDALLGEHLRQARDLIEKQFLTVIPRRARARSVTRSSFPWNERTADRRARMQAPGWLREGNNGAPVLECRFAYGISARPLTRGWNDGARRRFGAIGVTDVLATSSP